MPSSHLRDFRSVRTFCASATRHAKYNTHVPLSGWAAEIRIGVREEDAREAVVFSGTSNVSLLLRYQLEYVHCIFISDAFD